MPATVVLITVPGHPTLLTSGYLVRHIADRWRERGVNFEITTDPAVAPAGDLAWLHLDVTQPPPAYLRLAARYPVVVNGRAGDMAKRTTASHLLNGDDAWDGPVMLKTNLDYGGRPENWASRWGPLRHPRFHALRDRLPARITGRLDPLAYPVYESKMAVPRWAWANRRFVVQRFLPERRGDLYGVRRWFFLGDADFVYLSHGPKPIVEGSDSLEWSPLLAPPETLRAVRAAHGLDYGKIDYGEVDGELVIYDINPSPSLHGAPESGIPSALVDALVPGLELFLERAGMPNS